ncbi:hypothetical protein ACFL1H_03130 [Nanoarchaeota archaeon]
MKKSLNEESRDNAKAKMGGELPNPSNNTKKIKVSAISFGILSIGCILGYTLLNYPDEEEINYNLIESHERLMTTTDGHFNNLIRKNDKFVYELGNRLIFTDKNNNFANISHVNSKIKDRSFYKNRLLVWDGQESSKNGKISVIKYKLNSSDINYANTLYNMVWSESIFNLDDLVTDKEDKEKIGIPFEAKYGPWDTSDIYVCNNKYGIFKVKKKSNKIKIENLNLETFSKEFSCINDKWGHGVFDVSESESNPFLIFALNKDDFMELKLLDLNDNIYTHLDWADNFKASISDKGNVIVYQKHVNKTDEDTMVFYNLETKNQKSIRLNNISMKNQSIKINVIGTKAFYYNNLNEIHVKDLENLQEPAKVVECNYHTFGIDSENHFEISADGNTLYAPCERHLGEGEVVVDLYKVDINKSE